MFYVTHYNKTSKSGPEEGGWYTEGWIVDWSEPCKTEEDAIKLLGDYYKEFYNTKNIPEDLDDSFEDNDELFIIEDEANRGHLHSEPLSWVEAESEDFEAEQPVFDSEGVAHFPERERLEKIRDERYAFKRELQKLDDHKYAENHSNEENAPRSIMVVQEVNRDDTVTMLMSFLEEGLSEEKVKKYVDDFFKRHDLIYSDYDVDIHSFDDATVSAAFVTVKIPMQPKFNESLKKVSEDTYDSKQHSDIRLAVKDAIRELIMNNVEDNLEKVLSSKVDGYDDIDASYAFSDNQQYMINAARDRYIDTLTNAALRTHFIEDVAVEDNKEVIKESQEDDDVFVVCDHCLAAIESHEGNQITTKEIPEDRLYEAETDSDGNVELFGICDWCGEEFTEDELVRIM